MRCSAARRVGEAELLWHGDADLRGVDAVIVPGGFSYGDYLRVGAIARFAPVMGEIERFARARRARCSGICNGFQVLCEAGLLPGALLPNTSLKFICRQVGARGRQRVDVLDRRVRGRATRSRSRSSTRPAATGRPIPCSTSSRPTARSSCAIAPGENFNGSSRDIAGVVEQGGQRGRA